MHCFVATSTAWCKAEMVSELQIILNPLLPGTFCIFYYLFTSIPYVICVDIVIIYTVTFSVPDDPMSWVLKSWVWSCLHFCTEAPLNRCYYWSRSTIKLLRLFSGCDLFRAQLGNNLCRVRTSWCSWSAPPSKCTIGLWNIIFNENPCNIQR
jgi:hypothetical protein